MCFSCGVVRFVSRRCLKVVTNERDSHLFVLYCKGCEVSCDEAKRKRSFFCFVFYATTDDADASSSDDDSSSSSGSEEDEDNYEDNHDHEGGDGGVMQRGEGSSAAEGASGRATEERSHKR